MDRFSCLAASAGDCVDSSEIVKLGFELVGGLTILVGALFGARQAFRKMSLMASSEERAFKGEGTIFKQYESLIESQTKELNRMRGEMERLADLATSQERTLTTIKNEHIVAQRISRSFYQELAELKERQTRMVESGEMSRPLLDIPTQMLTDVPTVMRRFEPDLNERFRKK